MSAFEKCTQKAHIQRMWIWKKVWTIWDYSEISVNYNWLTKHPVGFVSCLLLLKANCIVGGQYYIRYILNF